MVQPDLVTTLIKLLMKPGGVFMSWGAWLPWEHGVQSSSVLTEHCYHSLRQLANQNCFLLVQSNSWDIFFKFKQEKSVCMNTSHSCVIDIRQNLEIPKTHILISSSSSIKGRTGVGHNSIYITSARISRK